MHFLIGDPEGAQLTAVLSYRSSPLEAFIPFESYSTPSDTASRSRLVSLLSLPNSEEFQLKVSVSDGTLSWSDSTAPFKKRSMRVLLPPTKVHFKGLADVTPTVSLVDRAAIRYNEYTITFSDTASTAQKTFTVWNPLGGSSVIPLYPGLESAVFDGMALYADDIQTDIDKVRSRWNHVPQGATWNFNATVADLPYYSYKGYRQPYDYLVVFDDAIVDTTAPFDLVGLVPLPVNYRVLNAATGEKIRCAAVDESGYKDVILLEDIMGRERATWRIYVTFSPQDQPPGRGDTVLVVTRKGLSYHDTLTLGDLLSTVATGPNVPGSYALEQNFPNPFNPSTSITYAIGAAGFVTLKVYDILGREVSTLVSERQSAGSHGARFDGTHLASGVYFYRLQSGAFTDTKKLLLIH
jgi:hypothetical protein